MAAVRQTGFSKETYLDYSTPLEPIIYISTIFRKKHRDRRQRNAPKMKFETGLLAAEFYFYGSNFDNCYPLRTFLYIIVGA